MKMKKGLKNISLNKTAKSNFITYGMVIVAFIITEICLAGGLVSSLLKGQLVPICVYIVMASVRGACLKGELYEGRVVCGFSVLFFYSVGDKERCRVSSYYQVFSRLDSFFLKITCHIFAPLL